MLIQLENKNKKINIWINIHIYVKRQFIENNEYVINPINYEDWLEYTNYSFL